MKRDLKKIEAFYKELVDDINHWLPEDVIEVDVELLMHFDLLDYRENDRQEDALTCYFNVIESSEKITLINDEFIIWIVPAKIDDLQLTYTIICLNDDPQPKPILCFINSGVYNNSKLVLRVLEKFIFEIRENELICCKYTDYQ